MYKDQANFNGGGRWTLAQWLKAFFTAEGIAGYRAYVSAEKELSEAELRKARRVPYHAPQWLTSLIVKAMIGRDCNVYKYHNIVPTVARAQVAKALTANIASVNEVKITHQELGTGTNTPANTDTGLQTPSSGTRKVISSLAYSNNVIALTCFWSAGEATGTWKECATFIDGNSGNILFNRIALDVTVSASNALTIDGTVTLT